MNESSPSWQTYEEVALYILNELASNFGLARFEGKQTIVGNRSRTRYKIDAKGISADGEAFVIVECRRYTTSRQNQEKVGGLAYRIIDTGARGGIIVSPLGLQEGAARIASAGNIHSVILDETCTPHQFAVMFLNSVLICPPAATTVANALAPTIQVSKANTHER